mmetsp:Transcript_86224/g.192060  ORF Transcript_86224/g.192060 Transcript_86224/m.192060 type:complete len:229 (+) Transcript_86224:938-1624(+)
MLRSEADSSLPPPFLTPNEVEASALATATAISEGNAPKDVSEPPLAQGKPGPGGPELHILLCLPRLLPLRDVRTSRLAQAASPDVVPALNPACGSVWPWRLASAAGVGAAASASAAASSEHSVPAAAVATRPCRASCCLGALAKAASTAVRPFAGVATHVTHGSTVSGGSKDAASGAGCKEVGNGGICVNSSGPRKLIPMRAGNASSVRTWRSATTSAGAEAALLLLD